MANVSVKVLGQAALRGAIARKILNVNNEAKRQVQESTIRIESDAKQFAPVDTGRLRSSISREIEGASGRVYTVVEYAPYVEFGTSGRPASPFMQPAVEAERKRLPAEFRKNISNAVRK